jgi:hypothetical protein
MFCGKEGNPTVPGQYGMIEVRARVVNQSLAKGAARSAAAQTMAERLVVEISGNGVAPVRIERKLDFSRPSVTDTVTKVPVGKNLRVVFWAVDKNGVTTHIDSVESRTLTIENAAVAQAFVTLIPAAGSIYLQFAGLETSVSAVYASFSELDGTLVSENRVARASRTFMSVDNIPHLTVGVLKVATLDSKGDTLFIARKELTFDARSDNSIDLLFKEYTGMIGADVTLYAPGVTTAAYNFGKSGNSELTAAETGELIITEIMWSSSNDNYIELYNTTDEALFFEELEVDIDGTSRGYSEITVAPGSYFVVGRRDLPYANVYPPSTTGFPITSTGNFITVRRKDGTVLDRVICPGSSSALGWPTMTTTAKRSIELSRDKYNAFDNNFGKNWRASEAEQIEATDQYGTPGW